nr:hypothetical protein [Saprospiraceae bacterium]
VFEEQSALSYPTGVASLLRTRLPTQKWQGEHQVRVVIIDNAGTTVAKNNFGFHVFQPKQLKFKRGKLSLFTRDSTLSNFLRDKGIDWTRFGPTTSLSEVVLVSAYPSSTTASQSFEELLAFVERGGTAIYLKPQEKQGMVDADHAAFPFTARVHPSRGLWTCMPHLVHDHPIFTGLPTGGPMRDLYENIWPVHTLRDINLEGALAELPIVGTVAFDWFSREHKFHYSGPGDSWWGSDLLVIPYGKGKLLVSQLRILENLGVDPVADKILANMLDHFHKR